MDKKDLIINECCSRFKKTKEDVISKSRKAGIVKFRFYIFNMLRNETKMTLSEIGFIIGNRDHSTVIHGLERFQLEIDLEWLDIFQIESDYHAIMININRKTEKQKISDDPILKALIALIDNYDYWLETGISADKDTSKNLYDNAKSAVTEIFGVMVNNKMLISKFTRL